MKYKMIVDQLFLDKYDNSIEYKKDSEIIIEDKKRAKDLEKRKLAHTIEDIEEKKDSKKSKKK